MPVFVSDHVPLGEWTALRAEARLKLIEEADVEIDLLVVRTVEGAGRRARGATRGLGVAGKDHGGRRCVRRAASSVELVAPVFLHAVHEADDATVRALVGVRTGTTVLHRLGAFDRRLGGRVD